MTANFLTNLPAIEGFSSGDDVRIVTYQHGRLAHAPFDGIAQMVLPSGGTEGQILAIVGGEPTWINNIGYSKGSWTPSIAFGGGSVGQAYSSQSGGYIRIGDLVFIRFRVQFSNKGTSTGNAHLVGLPFEIPVSSNGVVISGYYNNMSLPNPGITGFGGSGFSIQLRSLSTTTTSNLTDANFTNTSLLIGSFIYEAA